MTDTRIGNAYATSIKCRFCDFTTYRWKTFKNGNRRSGYANLEAHVVDEHPDEWRRVGMDRVARIEDQLGDAGSRELAKEIAARFTDEQLEDMTDLEYFAMAVEVKSRLIR